MEKTKLNRRTFAQVAGAVPRDKSEVIEKTLR